VNCGVMKMMRMSEEVTSRNSCPLSRPPILSDGYVKKVIKGFGYIIKLDEKAPNEYAWETDEVLAFPSDIEEIV